jgi:hypothetical protein
MGTRDKLFYYVLGPMVLPLLVSVVAAQQASNPIQVENVRRGTTDWQLSNPAANREIEGYASAASSPW